MSKFKCTKCGESFEGEKTSCPFCGSFFKNAPDNVKNLVIKRANVKDVCNKYLEAIIGFNSHQESVDKMFKVLVSLVMHLSPNQPKGQKNINVSGIKLQPRLKNTVVCCVILDKITEISIQAKVALDDFEKRYSKSFNYLNKHKGVFSWKLRDKKETIINYRKLTSEYSEKMMDISGFLMEKATAILELNDDELIKEYYKKPSYYIDLLNSLKIANFILITNTNNTEETEPLNYQTIRQPVHTGLSVTNRIKVIKQPRLGYVKVSDMEVTQLSFNKTLHDDCKTSPQIIGLAVDYLTRYLNGTSKNDAFAISIIGANMIKDLKTMQFLLSKINGLDDQSISAAIKAVGYDAVFRAGYPYKADLKQNVDKHSIEDVREMVNRSLSFFKKYGPVVKDGFTFEGGYTKTISSGDGDFLTKDTLWDFKTTKTEPTSKHTLQLLIYYLMGKHSIHPEFKTIRYVGIYNPRLNKVYKYDLSKIDVQTISQVEKDIIGY